MIDIADPEDGLLEYEAEMTAYLREREEMFVVSPSFLEQGSVTTEHRAVLVDWLLQVDVVPERWTWIRIECCYKKTFIHF